VHFDVWPRQTTRYFWRREVKAWKQGRYVAGLWSSDQFLFQLCWRRDQDPRPKPTRYRAICRPWAAVDGAVSYKHADGDVRNYAELRLLIELVSLRTEPEELDDFGQICMAALLVNYEDLLPMTSTT
jgi:hypothetical protein